MLSKKDIRNKILADYNTFCARTLIVSVFVFLGSCLYLWQQMLEGIEFIERFGVRGFCEVGIGLVIQYAISFALSAVIVALGMGILLMPTIPMKNEAN